jgi:hypothetical protein
MALSQRTQCAPLGCRSTSKQPRLVSRLGAGGSSTRPARCGRSAAVKVANSLYGARYVRSHTHSARPRLYLEYVPLPHLRIHACKPQEVCLCMQCDDQARVHRSTSSCCCCRLPNRRGVSAHQTGRSQVQHSQPWSPFTPGPKPAGPHIAATLSVRVRRIIITAALVSPAAATAVATAAAEQLLVQLWVWAHLQCS